METCASVCDSGAAAAVADHGGSAVAEVVVQQPSHADQGRAQLPRFLDGRVLDGRVLEKPQELLRSAMLQQQHMQAALLKAEQSLAETRSALEQLVAQPRGAAASPSPRFELVEQVRRVLPTPEPDGAAQVAVLEARPPSPAFPSELATSLDAGKIRRTKTGQNLLSNMTPQDIPQLSKGLWPFLKAVSRRAVGHIAFEIGVLAVIITNSAVIGLESNLAVQDEVLEWAPLAENLFLVVYSLEIAVRLMARRSRSCDGWLLFDGLLVLSSYVERVIELMSGESAEQLMLLRLLRLVRLVRTFRMVRQVRPLWRLVHGLMTSLDTVLSTFLLLALVLYVFGVLGLELIATNSDFKSDPTTSEILQRNFSTLGFTMITLAQFVTMDSIAAIYLPLVRVQPWLTIYFTMLIFIISISVMNLVTAALVEGTLENARLLRQEEDRIRSVNTEKMLPEILELFDLADADGSGELAIEEMAQFEEAGHVPYQILDRASVGSMTELFNVLDVDKSGVVSREEFAEGLLDILLRDVSVSSLQQMKILRALRDSVARLEVEVTDLKGQTSIII